MRSLFATSASYTGWGEKGSTCEGQLLVVARPVLSSPSLMLRFLRLAAQTSPWASLCHLQKLSSPRAEWNQLQIVVHQRQKGLLEGVARMDFPFVCPSFSDGSCVNSNMVSLCFSGFAPSNNSVTGQKRDGPIQGSCGCFPNVAIFSEAVEVKNIGQQPARNADTATDGSLSVFSERFLTECSCLERKAIAVALRPM